VLRLAKKELIFPALVIFLTVFYSYTIFAYFPNRNVDFDSSLKTMIINDNGLHFKATTNTNSVSELLKEKNIKLEDRDQIIPSEDAKVYPGMNIEIQRAVKMKVEVDGKKIEIYTLEKNISRALAENNIILTRLDRTDPGLNSLPQNNITVIVTRINVEEITKQEDINFKIITKNDNKLGWREKKIETPGENGIKEVKYKITYKNGKEISRIVLSKSVVKDPVTQVEIQGTYVKVGKAQKGQGTWYSYQGGMYAASLSIPRGNYARVTNTTNGKSVIVQINDSGPYGKGRIIDLDKPAFQKIAPLGAGVIGVKVEEVLN
jgi:uncharacterized protein YabE (DUF348 family)